MAFRSGMELASSDSCVLLDGDLQDPPELIKDFYQKWNEGYDIVYGHRIKREMNPFLHFFYKVFYFIFYKMADFYIPRDAGDFSLIDRKAVRVLLAATERDLFLRGLRAYVGFKQIGIPYKRPERMFGVSTNNWGKNFEWAKKAIFSYSNKPINILTSFGIVLFIFSCLALVYVIVASFIDQSIPRGVPMIIVLILFFGGINMIGLAILGEYIGKIIIEVKKRPPLIRESLIQNGRINREIREKERIPN